MCVVSALNLCSQKISLKKKNVQASLCVLGALSTYYYYYIEGERTLPVSRDKEECAGPDLHSRTDPSCGQEEKHAGSWSLRHRELH